MTDKALSHDDLLSVARNAHATATEAFPDTGPRVPARSLLVVLVTAVFTLAAIWDNESGEVSEALKKS